MEELSREELIALATRLLQANAVLEERVRQLERQVSRNSEMRTYSAVVRVSRSTCTRASKVNVC